MKNVVLASIREHEGGREMELNVRFENEHGEELKVKKVNIKEGNIVKVIAPDHMSKSDLKMFHEHIEHALQNHNGVITLPESVKLEFITQDK